MWYAVARRLVLPVLFLASVAGAPTASAAGSVSITFSATYGTAIATHSVTKVATVCEVEVSSGADGLAVLQAAKASGCIDSFATETFEGFGSFLDCIDGVCGGADHLGVACWFWGMHLNGPPTEYGLDGYSAEPGDVLTFVFQPYGPAALGWC